jgi:hypothetical protein
LGVLSPGERRNWKGDKIPTSRGQLTDYLSHRLGSNPRRFETMEHGGEYPDTIRKLSN